MYMLSTTIVTQACECNMHHDANHWLFNQWWYSAILLVIIGLVLVYLLFEKRKFLVDNLKWIAAVVFLSGFVIYGYAFDEGGSASNSVALAFRAALSSMEMFASHSDLLEVPKHLHENPFYMTIFSVIHFLAVIVSAVFIIKLLGFRFISWLRLLAANFPRKKDCRLFVFWGVNDNAILLANSIQKKAELKKENVKEWKNCKFVFVRLLSANESSSHGRFTFSHFFNSSHDGTEKFIEKIEELDGILVNSKFGITGRVIDKVKSEFDLYKYLGLKRLGKLIKKYPQATFYFLSQNEEQNLEAVAVFKEIAQYKEDRVHDQVQIYCHARKNNKNQELEICGESALHIHIIDSSNLAILQLKKNVKNHPVSFVDVNTSKACATKPFTSMIIGFGETGRDAFRFLYEFSALVDIEGNSNPRKIYVVDEHIDDLKGDFLMKAPALQEQELEKELEWCKMSTHSICFWQSVSKIIHDLNYVVIAIGDDNEGMSLAIDLYEYAYRYRRDCFKDFRIYLRVNENCNSIQLKQIRAYFDVAGGTSDVIVTFGAKAEIFSYDVVSVDVLEKLAKEFYYAYQKIMIDVLPETSEEEIAEKKEKQQKLEKTAEKEWNLRRENIKKDWKKNYPHKQLLEYHWKLAYQEEQDRANVWHIKTKRYLAGAMREDGSDNMKELDKMVLITHRDSKTINYPNVRDLASETLFDNLSKCEHLRWNACMELQGFVTCDGDKDFRRKEHKCLVDNDVLRSKYPETVPYDQCVVELSFRLKID